MGHHRNEYRPPDVDPDIQDESDDQGEDDEAHAADEDQSDVVGHDQVVPVEVEAGVLNEIWTLIGHYYVQNSDRPNRGKKVRLNLFTPVRSFTSAK